MIKNARNILLISAASLAVSCVNEQPSQVSERTCEEVLASFSVIPTTAQNAEERLIMLETIKAEQEAEYAEDCSRFAGWAERFEAAYAQARREVPVLISDDMAEINAVEIDE